MARHETDILVSGGGIAGLAAAAAFGAAGFSVLCVDPAAPVTDAGAGGADMRTSALMQPSVALLERVGLWYRLAPHATALQVMRIVEAGGPDGGKARLAQDFDASDISDAPFAWNLPNWLLKRELVARLEQLANVEFRPGTGTVASGLVTRESAALVPLSDGSRIVARLLIAADGRDSPIRAALGIGTRTTRYGQKALAFAATHAQAHRNISTEVHRDGGPFTLVPLPDHQGQPSSAVVWMARGDEIRRLAGLPPDAFDAEMTARSAGVLGPLRRVTPLGIWPIISRIAERFSAQRTALMAEAAHVVPPIGAQGLNMSLADLETLLDLASATPSALGESAMLATYDRRRRTEARMRMAGIDMLNRASITGQPALHELRALGLRAIHAATPLRRALMRLGMGAGRGARTK